MPAHTRNSRQSHAQAAQLTARGIQPKLIPNPTAAAQAYLARVRQQAVDSKDAVARLAPVLAAMRLAAQNALRQASVVGRALLQTVLDGLIAALEVLAARLGTMLVTPLVIPKSLLEKLAQEREATTA